MFVAASARAAPVYGTAYVQQVSVLIPKGLARQVRGKLDNGCNRVTVLIEGLHCEGRPYQKVPGPQAVC